MSTQRSVSYCMKDANKRQLHGTYSRNIHLVTVYIAHTSRNTWAEGLLVLKFELEDKLRLLSVVSISSKELEYNGELRYGEEDGELRSLLLLLLLLLKLLIFPNPDARWAA